MPLLNKNVLLAAPSLLKALTTSKHQRKLVNDFGERQLAPLGMKTVYVWQAEIAVVEEPLVVASTAATTCCIVAIVSSDAGWSIIAHLDDRMDAQLPILEAHLQKRPPGAAQVFIVGCHGREGASKAEALLQCLHGIQHLQLHAALSAVGRLNLDRASGNVMYQDLAVDTATATAMPGCKQGRGPLLSQRMARSWTSMKTRPLEPVFQAASGQMSIAPVTVDWSIVTRGYVQALQDSRDDEILEETSTSPELEKPTFVTDVRAALEWLLGHPERSSACLPSPHGDPGDTTFEWRDHEWTKCS